MVAGGLGNESRTQRTTKLVVNLLFLPASCIAWPGPDSKGAQNCILKIERASGVPKYCKEDSWNAEKVWEFPVVIFLSLFHSLLHSLASGKL